MKVREKHLLEIMALKKVTRRDLARMLGVHISLITHVLKGRRRLNIKHTKILMNFFGANLMSRAIDWEGIDVHNPM